MIDSDRLKKIKTFQDIKLEKAKLRYEALLAENRLFENLNEIQGQFTFPLFLTRFKDGFAFASKIYSNVNSILGKVFRKKAQPDQTGFAK
jgi:hypothetical protein